MGEETYRWNVLLENLNIFILISITNLILFISICNTFFSQILGIQEI